MIKCGRFDNNVNVSSDGLVISGGGLAGLIFLNVCNDENIFKFARFWFLVCVIEIDWQEFVRFLQFFKACGTKFFLGIFTPTRPSGGMYL